MGCPSCIQCCIYITWISSPVDSRGNLVVIWNQFSSNNYWQADANLRMLSEPDSNSHHEEYFSEQLQADNYAEVKSPKNEKELWAILLFWLIVSCIRDLDSWRYTNDWKILNESHWIYSTQKFALFIYIGIQFWNICWSEFQSGIEAHSITHQFRLKTGGVFELLNCKKGCNKFKK